MKKSRKKPVGVSVPVSVRGMANSFEPHGTGATGLHVVGIGASAGGLEALEWERKILQAVMDGARNSHLAYLDRDFNFVQVNEAYARSCGYTPEQMIGKNHFALYPNAENEAIFARARDTGEPAEFHDKPFIFPDQPERGITYWDWTLNPVKDGAGMVVGLVFSLFETTARKRAEEKLRESEERYEGLFEDDLTGDFISTAEGEIVLCNPAFARIFGFSSAEEAVGTSMLDLHLDVQDRKQLVERVKEHRKVESFKGWRKRRDGTPIHIVENLVGHFNERGELLEIKGYIFDDTNRKQAEERLQTDILALMQMHNLSCRPMEAGGIGPLLQDVIDTAVAIAGAERGTLQLLEGESLKIVAHHGHGAPFLEFFDSAETRASVCGEATRRGERVVVPDVQKSPLFAGTESLAVLSGAGVRAVQSTPLMSRSGKLLGILTTQWGRPYQPNEHDLWRIDLLVRQASDLIEQARAEEALRISQERLNQAVAVAGLGTFEHDHVTGAVEYSPLLRELMGFDLEEKVTLAAIIERVVPEDREAMVEAVRRAHDPAGEGKFAVDHRVRKADGRVRWVSVRSQTFFEGEGSGRRPIRTIGAGLDITEQKEFQAELQRLVDERTSRLQELVGELEHFSYTITHDLKSPLRAMRGFAEMMTVTCGECDRTQEREFLGRISTSADRMDRLIADALNYSRLVRQELPLEDVDAGALLRGMLDSYPEFQPDRARIVVDGRLPEVLANQAGLTQVFSNLLGNAVKFVKPGEVPEIRVWAEGEAQGGPGGQPPCTVQSGWVRIWVEDKGIGISKGMLPRVFDMFARGSKDYEGTGIGLALVRKVAQRMGGKVGVESEEGRGSRFWIELKCGEAKIAFSGPTARQGGREQSGTVLYVEDEESDAMFMELAFAKKGLAGKLQLVGDGRAAIDYLSGAGKYGDRGKYPVPALVLLDLNLPQVGGFEVLRWMRNNPEFGKTPVVIFSSSTREDDRVTARELGANEFVSKPNSGLEFGGVVEGLRGKWMGPSAPV